MKITMIAALSIATAATVLPLAATAHADPTSTYHFRSPSGNIGCTMEEERDGSAFAVCKIDDHTWVAPSSGYCKLAYVPGSVGEPGTDLQLGQGNAPCTGSAMIQIFFSGPYAAPALDYGQTHSVGTITCGSQPSGVTCTDTSTGHFFRVSRESYELG
jgi:hypothetical protein